MLVQDDAATRQWQDLLNALPCGVILARNIDDGLYPKEAFHVLALQDVPLPASGRKPLTGERKVGRIVLGLDSMSLPMPAEACFCATPDVEHVLKFEVWKERHRQHLYTLPTCVLCVRTISRLTGLPADKIKGTRWSTVPRR
jgi:hypothetical protein